MKKIRVITIVTLAFLLILSSCSRTEDTSGLNDNTKTPKPTETPVSVVEISGRIIETIDGDYTIIRNEEDTSIYYKIDISEGIEAETGVLNDLEPDNVITARVEVTDGEAFPIETRLWSLTANISPSYNVIDAKEAKRIIDGGDVIILDVRTFEEFGAGYIPDAFNLPLGTVKEGIDKIINDKQATILVYCRSGNRSKVAARELTEMGYENVYDFGGIVDWPYEIVNP